MIESIPTKRQISPLAIDTATMSQTQVTTVVFSHYVRAECELRYKVWLNKISKLAKYFPGHNTMKVERSPSIFCLKYTLLLRFDTYKNLYLWIKSPIRREWFSIAEPLIEKEENPKISTSYKPVISLPEAKKSIVLSSPPQYKNTIVTWIGVYICASGLGIILTPVLAGLPYLVGQAIATGAVVIILDYVLMPRLQAWFGGWLEH